MRTDISGWTTRLDDAATLRYRASGIWRNRTLADDARALAEANPEHVCCIANQESLTIARALADAEALAAGLWDLGLRPGQVVSFQLPNWPECFVVNLACAMLGCVANPIVPINRNAELEFILGDSRSRILFVPEEYRNYRHADMLGGIRARLPQLRHVAVVRGEGGDLAYAELLRMGRGRSMAWPRVAPDSIKMVMYTSGTTGRAKGVLHSHETLARSLEYMASSIQPRGGNVYLQSGPVTHVGGYLKGLEMPCYFGTTTVLVNRWNAAEAVQLVLEHGVTHTSGGPFVRELMEAAIAAGTDLPTLRNFSCGGTAVGAELIRGAQKTFSNASVHRIYGSTEAPTVTQCFSGGERERLSADTDGKIFDYDVRIVDGDGCDLGNGQEGEILVRGPSLFLGYTDPDSNAGAFDEQGYFRTGDLGVRSDDDAITITGRKKDLIIRGGENLSAREIEEALLRHTAIREAAVVAMPHARLGETACAYVITEATKTLTLEEVTAFLVEAGLAKQKIPEHLVLVDDFQRTAYGKIRKDVLRSDIAARLAGEEVRPGHAIGRGSPASAKQQ